LTKISATQLGEIASQSFSKTKSGKIGEVIASFQNSFYIRTLDDELVFVTNRSPGSPITVNVTSNSNFAKLALPNSLVTLFENELLIGEDATICLETSRPYKDAITSLPSKLALNHKALDSLAFILGILDVTSSVLDANAIAHDETRRFARKAGIPLMGSLDQTQFMRQTFELVGLGTGFTPSGDDFLGGFLATWNSFAEMVGRSKILLDFELLSHNTSWISAKLLDYMQRELLDSQVALAIRAALFGDEEDFVLAVETLLARGHTSGVDMATGIILATSLILDIGNHTRLTENLLNRLRL